MDELPKGSECMVEGVTCYPWHIDTKYYTTDVNLCVAANRTIGNQEFADCVQAFIILFDSQEVHVWEVETILGLLYTCITST